MDFLNQKGGVKRILLKGELKIFQQRGAKLPLGHTLNWGVQMKKISFGGGKKNFSYGILNTCPRMTLRAASYTHNLIYKLQNESALKKSTLPNTQIWF